MGLVDHQPRAVLLAERDDLGQRRDVALHRVDAVDHDEDAAAVLLRGLQPLLEQVQAVVAERAQLRLREQAAVEDRGVVARVGDHGVLRAEDRAERAEVGLMAGGEDERVLGPEPLGELALELDVQIDRAVEEARARQAGAVAVERVAGALLDALVAGQPQVVVGAEHDPALTLHLDDGQGRPLQHVEVRARRRSRGRRGVARGARTLEPWRKRRSRSSGNRIVTSRLAMSQVDSAAGAVTILQVPTEEDVYEIEVLDGELVAAVGTPAGAVGAERSAAGAQPRRADGGGRSDRLRRRGRDDGAAAPLRVRPSGSSVRG